MVQKLIVALCVLCLLGERVEAQSAGNSGEAVECQIRLMAVLGRLSDDRRSIRVGVEATKLVKRAGLEDLVKPNWQASFARQNTKSLQFQLGSFLDMKEALEQTRGKGFWVFQTPSDPGQKLATSHHAIGVNGILFNRLSDDLGENALRSFTPEEVVGLVGMQPYILGQFFELSDEATKVLEKFFHDRVWHYHAKTPGWTSQYDRMPSPSQASAGDCENCSVVNRQNIWDS